jgi:hypothetical protein
VHQQDKRHRAQGRATVSDKEQRERDDKDDDLEYRLDELWITTGWFREDSPDKSLLISELSHVPRVGDMVRLHLPQRQGILTGSVIEVWWDIDPWTKIRPAKEQVSIVLGDCEIGPERQQAKTD